MSAVDPTITFRPMLPTDLDACMALKSLANWNQLRRDWELFLGFNPGGCIVACDGERVVGTVTSIDYEGRFSWIGMVLVHPDCRRRGIGTGLLQAAMDSLAACETIKLDATPAGKMLYDGLGFVDEYGLARLTAASLPSLPPSPAQVVPATKADLAEIIAVDTPAFGVCRGRVLEAWMERTPQAAFVVRRGNGVAGYALGRPGANFATVGPVVAGAEADARALAAAVARALGPGPVCIDIPEHTPSFRTWLESLGFAMQRPFIRMARGPNRFPGVPGRVWAILGPEVG